MDPGSPPGRQNHYLVARMQLARLDPARVCPIVRIGRTGPNYPLDWEAEGGAGRRDGHLHRLQVIEERRPVIPGHSARAVDDVVARQRRYRDVRDLRKSQTLGQAGEVRPDLLESRFLEIDQI